MGIDILDLVTKIERSFSIKIPDKDIQSISSVGALHNYILTRTSLAPAGSCLTAAAFLELERGLRECGFEDHFGPSSKLVSVISKQNRREIWNRLSVAADLKLPKLRRSFGLVVFNFLFALLALSGCMLTGLGDGIHAALNPFVWFPLFLSFFWLGYLMTQPFAREFGYDPATFRKLSERVLVLNTQQLTRRHGKMGRNDTWIILRSIIVDVLGVENDEVIETADIYKDLGCS